MAKSVVISVASPGDAETIAAILLDAFREFVAAVDRDDEVYVRSMAVTPGARGAGVAAALLDAVTRFALETGARRMRLPTTPFLHDAIRLYERAGFERLPGPLDLHGTPLVGMAKDLVENSGGRSSSR